MVYFLIFFLKLYTFDAFCMHLGASLCHRESFLTYHYNSNILHNTYDKLVYLFIKEIIKKKHTQTAIHMASTGTSSILLQSQ
jgi:hypothetical protein